MENEKELTQEESLLIITDMINAAKNDVKGDSFIFLLWGWLVFIASISHYLIVVMKLDVQQNLPWMLMPIGGAITILYSIRKGKQNKTKTNITEFLKFIWIAFGVALGIIMFFSKMDFKQELPCIMILYGMGLFLSGGALKFKPLIFGGIFCWICSIAGFYTPNVYLLLILAAAVLGGYIIPGYLLKMNNKK